MYVLTGASVDVPLLAALNEQLSKTLWKHRNDVKVTHGRPKAAADWNTVNNPIQPPTESPVRPAAAFSRVNPPQP